MTEVAATHPQHAPDSNLEHIGQILDSNWTDRAACRGVPPTVAEWFPERHQARAAATIEARRICNQECPVRDECLVYALVTNAHRDRGTWGGHTHRQLVALRVQLRQAGALPVIRVCANPACRRRFVAASMNTTRHNVCCSDACRLNRRRLLGRTARINRP